MQQYGDPTIFAIFGAGGDLAKRKLMPALYNLFLDRHLPEKFLIVGLSVDDNLAKFREEMGKGVDEFSRRGKADPAKWEEFVSHLDFIEGSFENSAPYDQLASLITKTESKWSSPANRVYYLSVPPTLIETIGRNLEKAKLNRERKRDRIVVEKPFGRDLASADSLNQLLQSIFNEHQIFRIDHYLGKETVQNMLALRFANAIYEPIWNRRYIDHVQITVAEEVGVELRGGYYDNAGALRDMVQNHLLQLLCIVAMEPPISFDADEIRTKKVDVLKAVRRIDPSEIHQVAVRGQYGSGSLGDSSVTGYRNEPNVDPSSGTETYAALKLFVDNWRWHDVPFYLRTGKRLPSRVSEITIVFRPVPHLMFPTTATDNWEPNRLIIGIQPDEGIDLRFHAKEPGTGMRLQMVDMDFTYREAFQASTPEAYETLLHDVMLGDGTLFMRADQEHAAWTIVTPVLEAWGSTTPSGFPNYSAGTWGPQAADMLLAHDGRSWYPPRTSKA